MIHVIGIGLEGAAGLSAAVLQIVQQASLLIGSERHLSYFPNHAGDRVVLGRFADALALLRQSLSPSLSSSPAPIVVLTSGDPLFFGFGRLLLEELPAESLTFHPHVSSVQLAFSRVKLPWQDAQIISAHGRSFDELVQALQQGTEKIAVLTDSVRSPGAIATLLLSLELPSSYQMWVCENLGGDDERILKIEQLASVQDQSFAALNVVILQRTENSVNLGTLPMFGLSDQKFLSFSDRPGLMTKREVRILVLAELAFQPEQVIWDIGAGTGSVAIEMARLCPTAQIYAIEKTAAGASLIRQNCDRFQVHNVHAIQGTAPEALKDLPQPDRIFIGGTGGNLEDILRVCTTQVHPEGVIVLALATLENLTQALTYLKAQNLKHRLLQVQIARSTPVASLTRLTPLNPVTLITIDAAKH